ncbi:NAD-dependent epimerase/dehydratase family protein [Siculibacillus lacustris]|uniref:NAD-dependent epimerase/dehydratase family protein n=1 Tax=Siculibacillus lacustris TaxID=1549641 RepID=A0A4Q9VNC6_9HYPH|nr:NAD(P)H-binding protein [Siculibacillus lacustris]TBW36623.1 NAD-dependent epimerase/dehydratase family protein [Siculibacillus lacustris]
MTDTRQALVLGATGGIGGEVARRLAARGWAVKALHREPARAARAGDGFDWVQGDATNPADVIGAAAGTSLIVHAVNPPGYRDWERLVVPMVDATIAAAKAAGARILLPGTVYNYGPDVFGAPIGEDAPQTPTTRKGAIRVEMERRLERAVEAGTPVLIVRAGDFFGPQAANNWFSQGLVKPGRPVTTITRPGAPGIGHQWAYLPDVAETMVRLVERPQGLAPFARFHMEGHWDADGEAMIAAIARAVAPAKPKISAFPWWLVGLARPAVAIFRELHEMHYLWKTPVRLDNAALVAALGAEPRTPLDTAVAATLAGLGCLTPAARSEAA